MPRPRTSKQPRRESLLPRRIRERPGIFFLFASCCHPRKNSERQNLLDHLRWFALALHAIVGELVGRQALLVEPAKAGLVAEKRPVGDVGAAVQQFLDGT